MKYYDPVCDRAEYLNLALRKSIKFPITELFMDSMVQCKDRSGVYFLSTGTDQIQYIGRSITLYKRVISSIRARIGNPDCQWYFQYILTDSVADAALLEIYFISKLKPVLNGDIVTPKDDLTIGITTAPDPSGFIPINQFPKPEHYDVGIWAI